MHAVLARAVPETTNRGVEHGRTNRRAGVGRGLSPSRVPVRPRAAARPSRSGLRVGAHRDRCEQEADRVADRVVAGSASVAPLRLGGHSTDVGAAPQSVASALAGAGRPLDPTVRAEMERRFDHDFSGVRIHTGPDARRSARDLRAQAYTVGTDVVVAETGFSPGTPSGRRLIAHELTHVVQQSREDRSDDRVQRAPATDAVAHAPDPINEDEHADHAWHLVATLPSRGRPSSAVIRAIVAENSRDANRDVLEATTIRLYPRNRVVAGTIRPSYFSYVHPTLGAVLRAFAVPSGIHPERMPDPKTLREETLEYEHYAFTPRAGDARLTYGFPVPLASAPKLSELEKPKPRPEPAHDPSAEEAPEIRPQANPENSLPYMMARWKAAGLLDGPGVKVRPIPPLPVTKDQAAQLKADLHARSRGSPPFAGYVPVAGFVSAGAPLEPAAVATGGAVDEALAAAAERSALSTAGEITTGAATAGAEETGVTLVSGAGAAAAGILAGAAVLLYPSSIAPDPPFSGITGNPTTSLWYQWETQLDPAQIEYLRRLWRIRLQPPPAPAPAPAPATDVEPATPTDVEPDQDRRRRQRCSPTGLWRSDPIPMVWYKPLNSALYPPEITIQGHAYRRDQPAHLPHGEPIGVRREYWPRIGKTFRLLPETRGSGADDFRAVLRGYGYDLTALGLQADHVQDIQWEGPDAFENLWPLDMRQNMSAGGRQNNFQLVTFCVTPQGPRLTLPISVVKLMRGGYGRWFSIARLQY